MTIAACYLSSEGVVFGADSTTTMYVAPPIAGQLGTDHYFNFAQKVFQIGDEGALGITMWGMGSFGERSFRTLIAELGDDIKATSPKSVAEVSDRWKEMSWSEYSTFFNDICQRTKELAGKGTRSQNEENELIFLRQTFSVGFCLGGYCLPDRTPHAFEITFSPDMNAPEQPIAQSMGTSRFWGCPSLINRQIYGIDETLFYAIRDSGKWTGTEDELFELVEQCSSLGLPAQLPIREAIDWVHASIYATIKTMKFSHMAPVCGGPIEVAVITTDRPFRWACHKKLNAAIHSEGLLNG